MLIHIIKHFQSKSWVPSAVRTWWFIVRTKSIETLIRCEMNKRPNAVYNRYNAKQETQHCHWLLSFLCVFSLFALSPFYTHPAIIPCLDSFIYELQTKMHRLIEERRGNYKPKSRINISSHETHHANIVQSFWFFFFFFSFFSNTWFICCLLLITDPWIYAAFLYCLYTGMAAKPTDSTKSDEILSCGC